MSLPDSISRQNRLFAQKRKEKHLLCSHRHTTVIAGPTCLIAHLLAPHDRAFSLLAIVVCRAGHDAADQRRHGRTRQGRCRCMSCRACLSPSSARCSMSLHYTLSMSLCHRTTLCLLGSLRREVLFVCGVLGFLGVDTQALLSHSVGIWACL